MGVRTVYVACSRTCVIVQAGLAAQFKHRNRRHLYPDELSTGLRVPLWRDCKGGSLYWCMPCHQVSWAETNEAESEIGLSAIRRLWLLSH